MISRLGKAGAALVVCVGLAAAPAQAHPGTCSGTGTLTFDRGLYPAILAPRMLRVGFSISFSGSCTGVAGVDLEGVLDEAWCYDGTGTGTAQDAPTSLHPFAVRWSGAWVMTGAVNGTLSVALAPGEACHPGGWGADQFIVSGTFALA